MNFIEKKIALFDFDGTLVAGHPWLGIAKHNLKTKKNLLPTFCYIMSHLAAAPFWKAGLISTEKYYQSWGKGLAQLLRGTDIKKAKEIFNWLADGHLLPTLKKNVFERLKKHQEDGYLIILTSGSFQDLIEVFSSRLNIDFALGTELEIVKNRFSGRIIPPLCFGQEKVEKVKKFLSGNGLKINFQESFAYSDSFFDLPLLELVGHPIAVEPDKKLLRIARNKGWSII